MRGRPKQLTPEVAQRIIDSMQAGCSLATAANAAGVTPAILRGWISKGEKAKSGIYAAFAMAVREAESVGEDRLVTIVANAAMENAQHAEWLLERKYPARWGMRVQVTVEQELAKALDKIRLRLSPKEYEKVLEAIASDEYVQQQPQLPAAEQTIEPKKE